jgi:hypothetical protein
VNTVMNLRVLAPRSYLVILMSLGVFLASKDFVHIILVKIFISFFLQTLRNQFFADKCQCPSVLLSLLTYISSR